MLFVLPIINTQAHINIKIYPSLLNQPFIYFISKGFSFFFCLLFQQGLIGAAIPGYRDLGPLGDTTPNNIFCCSCHLHWVVLTTCHQIVPWPRQLG